MFMSETKIINWNNYFIMTTVGWGEVERKSKKNSRFILGTKNKIFLFH